MWKVHDEVLEIYSLLLLNWCNHYYNVPMQKKFKLPYLIEKLDIISEDELYMEIENSKLKDIQNTHYIFYDVAFTIDVLDTEVVYEYLDIQCHRWIVQQ